MAKTITFTQDELRYLHQAFDSSYIKHDKKAPAALRSVLRKINKAIDWKKGRPA